MTPDGSETPAVTLVRLAHFIPHLTTDDIALLLPPVPQFHVVDPHNRNFALVRVNNTIFHIGIAGHHVSIVPYGSVHEKEFLYTFPHPYVSGVQSESVVVDNHYQSHHNNQQHNHVSVLYE